MGARLHPGSGVPLRLCRGAARAHLPAAEQHLLFRQNHTSCAENFFAQCWKKWRFSSIQKWCFIRESTALGFPLEIKPQLLIFHAEIKKYFIFLESNCLGECWFYCAINMIINRNGVFIGSSASLLTCWLGKNHCGIGIKCKMEQIIVVRL